MRGGRELKNELLWARVATVLLGGAAMCFALFTGDMVALLGAFGWGTFAAALVPTVVIGLNWKRASAAAACTAVISSLGVNFAIKAFGVPVPLNMDPGAVALLVSIVLFVAVSLCTKPSGSPTPESVGSTVDKIGVETIESDNPSQAPPAN